MGTGFWKVRNIRVGSYDGIRWDTLIVGCAVSFTAFEGETAEGPLRFENGSGGDIVGDDEPHATAWQWAGRFDSQ